MSTCDLTSSPQPFQTPVLVAPATEAVEIPGLQELWNETLGDPRICIAVLDGPVDLAHPSFRGAAVTQLSTDDVTECRAVISDHGTHVASVIFGQHSSEVKGVAPNCRGLIVPIFDYAEDGSLKPSTQARLAKAIRLALHHGANIINISAGQFSSDGDASDELKAAVRECEGRALIVAAAGNDGCDCLQVPGALPSVLAVGAMNLRGEPMPFSNWGEAYQSHGVLAPGENILGASLDGGVARYTGTSFATPIVSGLAALLLSVQLRDSKTLNISAARDAVLQSSVGCDAQPTENCDKLLHGRLNISGSAEFVKRGTTTMTQPTTTSLPTEPQEVPTIVPASCGCGCQGNSAPQFVYPVGTIAYDFMSQNRKDSIEQHLPRVQAYGQSSRPMVDDPIDLLRYLCGFREIEVTVNSGQILDLTAHDTLPPFDKLKVTTNGGTPLTDEDDWRRVQLAGIRELESGVYQESSLNWQELRLGLTGNANEFYIRNRIFENKPYDLSNARWFLPRNSEVKQVHQPSTHDAKAIIWKLVRGGQHLYAIEPKDAFAEDAYRELVEFLLHAHGLTKESLDVYYYMEAGRAYSWFDVKRLESSFDWNPTFNNADCCHGNNDDLRKCCSNYEAQSEDVRSTGLMSHYGKSDRVAMPGRISGETQILDGTILPAIDPEMRGTVEWSVKRVMAGMHARLVADGFVDSEIAALTPLFEDLVDRLDEEARNPGMTSSDRALTFAYVQLLTAMATEHADELIVDRSGDKPIVMELDSVAVKEGAHCRQDSDCWDVEISFFNPKETHQALFVVRQSVDVRDVVPVYFDEPRGYRRR